MSISDGLPRSCRYCAEMTCGDINYCKLKGISISDAQLPVVRKCFHWVANTMAADSFKEWEPRPERKTTQCEGQMVIEMANGD